MAFRCLELGHSGHASALAVAIRDWEKNPSFPIRAILRIDTHHRHKQGKSLKYAQRVNRIIERPRLGAVLASFVSNIVFFVVDYEGV